MMMRHPAITATRLAVVSFGNRPRTQPSVGEQRMYRRPPLNERRDVIADRGAELESVPGPATHEPHVLELRMSVDEEMPVARRLVLTDASLHERCVSQGRESLPQNDARAPELVGRRCPVHRRRIDVLARGVVRDFETPPLVIGSAVHQALAEMNPYGQCPGVVPTVACGRAEEEHRLACGDDAAPDHVGKELPHPRSTREHEAVCLECAPV